VSYIITHRPSGDEAEAGSIDEAHLAARTLIDDNDRRGTSTIRLGEQVVGFVFPVDSEFSTGDFGRANLSGK